MIGTDLVIRCQQRDEAAFDAIYETLGKKAYWTAFLLTGDKSHAEDASQEAFFECFRDITKLKNPELFQAWFNRILVRKCWRIRPKEQLESFNDELKDYLKDESDICEAVEAHQLRLAVQAAVRGLKPQFRITIVLFYYNGLSIKEIAQTMKCLEGTVKSRLHYAKKALGKELGPFWEPEASEGNMLQGEGECVQ